MQLGEREIDGTDVGAVLHDLAEQLAGHRAELLLEHARNDRLLDERGDVGLLDPAEPVGQDAGADVDQALGMVSVDEPAAGPGRDLRGGDALAHDVLTEEVLRDELLQARAERLLALGDDRRVRDRQPHRMPEDGSDREPVGDRAHHRGLGASVDVAEHAVAVAGDQVHQGSEDQQGERERLHATQPAQSGGVTLAFTERNRQAARTGIRGHIGSVTTAGGNRPRA
jgi:hypothetical protein